jgi:hypothetical protein
MSGVSKSRCKSRGKSKGKSKSKSRGKIGRKSVRSNEKLWLQIKKKVMSESKGGPSGEWSARKAQIVVKMYKDKGGTYIGKKSADNSLVVWTNEKWDYVNTSDGKEGSIKRGDRYLPEKVRSMLSPAEIRAENRRKKQANASGERRAPYSKSVLEKIHKSRNE